MPKKLGRLITNNLGLKILSAVFAVIVWLVIVNTADPDKSATFSVPVQVVNAEYLTDAGMTYEVHENSETISFTVTGKRSIVEVLTTDDFRAVANMANIDDSMTMVPITLTATRYSSQLDISVRDSYLLVDVENLVTKDVEIAAITQGDPAEDCFVDSVEISPKKLSITGPESVVDSVDTARIVVDTTGAAGTLLTNEEITLVDENGEEVSQDRLTLGAKEVVAVTTVYMSKTIPVTYEVTGTPAEGYVYTGFDCDTDSVTVAGDPEVVADLDGIDVTSFLLSVEGAEGDIVADIYLPALLPDDVEIPDEDMQTAVVVMNVEAEVTEALEVPVRRLTINGLGEGLVCTVESENDTFIVNVTGLEEDIAAINVNGISGSIDVSGLGVGSYVLQVDLNGKYGSSCQSEVTVTISRG